MSRITVSLLALFLVSACGSSDRAAAPDLATMTEAYGCGHGFWIGDPDQTTALRIAYTPDDRTPADAVLPDPRWDVFVLEGADLYANWCDDVIEPDEPEPRVDRRLDVVGGSLEIVGEPPSEPFSGGPLTLVATGLVVELPSGETVELGDVTIENPTFGFLAG